MKRYSINGSLINAFEDSEDETATMRLFCARCCDDRGRGKATCLVDKAIGRFNWQMRALPQRVALHSKSTKPLGRTFHTHPTTFKFTVKAKQSSALIMTKKTAARRRRRKATQQESESTQNQNQLIQAIHGLDIATISNIASRYGVLPLFVSAAPSSPATL